MENVIVKLENVSVHYNQQKEKYPAVNAVNLKLIQGDSLGIIGESGSGKTSLAMALMGLLNKPTQVEGKIFYKDMDLNSLKEKEKNRFRWNKIAIVFQNSLEVLNPVLTIYEQILECIFRHTHLTTEEANKKVLQLLTLVGLSPTWRGYYPHQLSGGMRQRVLIAMALSCDPEVLIVDEPTTALDALSKKEIIALLLTLQTQKKFSMIVISHEMHTIASLTSKMAVMYAGNIVEMGFTKEILKHPMHTYTRGLIYASPEMNPYRDLWGIPGEAGQIYERHCPFYARCSQKVDICKTNIPKLSYVAIERKVACNRGGITTLLNAKDICKQYIFKGQKIIACNDCKIHVRTGEVVALIGESGSGKTTLASVLSGCLASDRGEVIFEGEKVQGNSATSRKHGVQIVFQDPFSAVNEHLTIEQAIREPLDIIKLETKEQRHISVLQALKDLQLPISDGFLQRKCYMLSGGQRQRVALARSLVMAPKLLIADEISAMLDPSTQANILRLLKGLQNERGFAMLYITHDLALVKKIADRVYVMHEGNIIENGTAMEVFRFPKARYTRMLVGKMKQENG